MDDLRGERIVMTGATSRAARPIALDLAGDNEVWAIGRFSDTETRQALEDAGVRTALLDLASPDFSSIEVEPTLVLHFARADIGAWDADLDVNVGGVLSLMEFAQGARAFLHCSTTGVYQPAGPSPRFRETDPLGDSHRTFVGGALSTYSISKIAAEAAVRWGARRYGVPTTIARLNVPYGAERSWPRSHLEMIIQGRPIPVRVNGPTEYNPIHVSDMIAMIPRLVAVASAPATILNWGGHEIVGIEEWSAYLGELIGVRPTFVRTDETLCSVSIDTSRMEELIGPTTVHWKDGFRQLVEQSYPERLTPSWQG